MKKLILSWFALFLFSSTYAQIDARLMRYVDVSDSRIAFVYGGDIWIMPKSGGDAVQVTHSPGEESWPRFSPDGEELAFTASYHGNEDVYVMPTLGGVPTRVTWNSFPDRMIDWHPDGKRVVFASSRQSGPRRLRQLYIAAKGGGFAEQLSVPYAELASYSPDGKHLAYITKITENYPLQAVPGWPCLRCPCLRPEEEHRRKHNQQPCE